MAKRNPQPDQHLYERKLGEHYGRAAAVTVCAQNASRTSQQGGGHTNEISVNTRHGRAVEAPCEAQNGTQKAPDDKPTGRQMYE